jgi:capsular polysaccharide transport system ATP-binding protein
MITLDHVTKSYATPHGIRTVLDDISCTFGERESVGVLGKNGAGKSTLLRMLGGAELPDFGEVLRSGRVSWPIGFGGGFATSLTGAENCRFAARIYDADVAEVIEKTREFAEIGHYFDMPIRTYSSGMKARLAFGLSMAIDFDVYLVDEVTAVGDRRFQKKCRDAFREREARSSVIIVSHQMKTIREYCSRCAVLWDGKLTFYDDLDEAQAAYDKAAA